MSPIGLEALFVGDPESESNLLASGLIRLAGLGGSAIFNFLMAFFTPQSVHMYMYHIGLTVMTPTHSQTFIPNLT